MLQKLLPLKDKEMPRHEFQKELAKVLTVGQELRQHEETIIKHAFSTRRSWVRPRCAVKRTDGKPILMGAVYKYRRLVGTTLHGTQIAEHQRHILDDFQFLTMPPTRWRTSRWRARYAIQNFDMRQEPLTYYHRTGPVGAMFRELRTREHRTRSPSRWSASAPAACRATPWKARSSPSTRSTRR